MNNGYLLESNFKECALGTVWFSRSKQAEITAFTIPILQHELIINFGDIFKVKNSQEVDKIIFSPIKTEIIKTEVKGRYEALGILFSPIGIYQNYGISVKELNRSDAIDTILFGKKIELQETVGSTSCPKKKLSLFTSFLKMNVLKKTCPTIVTDFLAFINKLHSIKIKCAAEILGYTSKHLIATFKDVVGITPMKYLQLVQLNRAVRAIDEYPNKTLTQIALENGFYDQPHFIRIFRKYTNMTPSAFKAKKLQHTNGFKNTIFV